MFGIKHFEKRLRIDSKWKYDETLPLHNTG